LLSAAKPLFSASGACYLSLKEVENLYFFKNSALFTCVCEIFVVPLQRNMIPRIKSYQPLADFQLLVSFDDGRKVRYDVADDIKTLPAFRDLKTEPGLFENAQLDASRTCIYWNDQIDLPSDTIYEYGVAL